MEEVDLFEDTKTPGNSADMKRKPKPLQVVLHDPSKPANVRAKSLSIPLGHFTTVYITPKVTHTDQTGRELPERHRGCRLANENRGLKIFKTYSREGCILECQMTRAARECGCYPWDFPISTNENEDILFCDIFGNVCFEKVMENTNTTSCDCPMDCDSISYSYNIFSTPIQPEEECSKQAFPYECRDSRDFLMP